MILTITLEFHRFTYILGPDSSHYEYHLTCKYAQAIKNPSYIYNSDIDMEFAGYDVILVIDLSYKHTLQYTVLLCLLTLHGPKGSGGVCLFVAGVLHFCVSTGPKQGG